MKDTLSSFKRKQKKIIADIIPYLSKLSIKDLQNVSFDVFISHYIDEYVRDFFKNKLQKVLLFENDNVVNFLSSRLPCSNCTISKPVPGYLRNILPTHKFNFQQTTISGISISGCDNLIIDGHDIYYGFVNICSVRHADSFEVLAALKAFPMFILPYQSFCHSNIKSIFDSAVSQRLKEDKVGLLANSAIAAVLSSSLPNLNNEADFIYLGSGKTKVVFKNPNFTAINPIIDHTNWMDHLDDIIQRIQYYQSVYELSTNQK